MDTCQSNFHGMEQSYCSAEGFGNEAHGRKD